ncbi:helix-turn-helix domain-containing protein [Proteiniborus sp. MB09-C3]|uniref:helix-turn-helix domain-containing protein n=1 Tax=Proteiniborus sp. MB09-C3 TaxID=3050072 RepID=UPI00255253CD|nr:helix-turn-helix domain-containing protein [Proteiniborus sp. MB09-C3]WIV11922.1 helix-turn-helix domain-containing protein [Proteiniborus sp. MB09-C3]
MRKEFVEYMTNVPISVSLVNILGYPLHWHDSIEILFVLKGSINVTIENETYIVEEKEIEIININEVHSIRSSDKDNRVLVFEIDPKFLKKYYNDIENVFFYTNSSEEGIQEKEEYYVLRNYLSQLLCEVTEKHDDYDDVVRESLLELLYHLLNHFHYLFYDEESLKGDDVQLERYHRIAKYISNNYMEKVSLQDIARNEFLSTQYLSYKIKNTFGYTFNDFLNFVRVMESTKLLLDTEMNISEISEEVGFSHVRYYNKHFKKHYKVTPMQYRKKYKVDDDKLEKMKQFTYFDLREGLDMASQYLEDYSRFNIEDRIETIDVDLSISEGDIDINSIDIIDLGDAMNLLIEDNMLIVVDIQKNIGFKYGIISNLISEEMGVYIGKNSDFINWRSIEKILDYFHKVDLIPIITILDIEEQDILKNLLLKFTDYFYNKYGNKMSEWRYAFNEGMGISLVADEIILEEQIINFDIKSKQAFEPDNAYDTCNIVTHIIQNCISVREDIILKAFDTPHKETKQDNELFFGDLGIVTQNGIRKPSYYGYYFLSKLGKNLIKQGEGFIITEENENIQILLYDVNDNKSNLKRKFSLNFMNIPNNYRIAKYEISENKGSSYGYWIAMGRPKRLGDDEIELLKRISFPETTFSSIKKSTFSNKIISINRNGTVLLEFKKVH